MKYTVNAKWGKRQFAGVELDTAEPPEVFRAQLFGLTGVPVERMKVVVPRGGQLKADSDWSKFPLKEGMTVTVVGSAATLKAPAEEVRFVEDLSAAEQAAATKAHPAGLANVGNTCYFNATLQALAGLPEFRAALAHCPAAALLGQEGLVAAAAKDVVGRLQREGAPLMPLVLLSAFRARFPQFAEQQHGAFAQQDADECLKQLLAALAPVPPLHAAPHASAVEQLFAGRLSTQTRCVEAPDETAAGEEAFLSLQCNIGSETSHLLQALQDSMRQSLTKHSSSLGRDAVFEKAVSIARLPYCLPVQFVRFYYNAKKKLNAKIVRPVTFAFRLDLYSLCTPELKQALDGPRAALEKLDLARASDRTAGADLAAMRPDDAALENRSGLYDLVAIVSHQGRAVDSGHYVAWVREGEDDEHWLKFDDAKVSRCSKEDVQKLSGKGGADWHMAYICIYRSVDVFAAEQFAASS